MDASGVLFTLIIVSTADWSTMREGGLVSALIWLNLSVSAALADQIIQLAP